MENLLTTGDVARILGISAEAVRAISRRGKIEMQRTVGGFRLYRKVDVDRLAKERGTSIARRDK